MKEIANEKSLQESGEYQQEEFKEGIPSEQKNVIKAQKYISVLGKQEIFYFHLIVVLGGWCERRFTGPIMFHSQYFSNILPYCDNIFGKVLVLSYTLYLVF